MPGTISVWPGLRPIPLRPLLRCRRAVSISAWVMNELDAQYLRTTTGRLSPLATTCSTVPGGATMGAPAAFTEEAAPGATGWFFGWCMALVGVNALTEKMMRMAATKRLAEMI